MRNLSLVMTVSSLESAGLFHAEEIAAERGGRDRSAGSNPRTPGSCSVRR